MQPQGYAHQFQLHNNTQQEIKPHVKEALIQYQEPLDIQITSAAIQEHPTTNYIHSEIPHHRLEDKLGHYNLKLTPAAHDALNQDEGLVERVLAQITNQQHNFYKLPELPTEDLRSDSQTTQVIRAYKRLIDVVTQTQYFGRISAQRHAANVVKPRVHARKRLLNVLAATKQEEEINVLAQEQRTDYLELLATKHLTATSNGLHRVAKYSLQELSKVFEEDMTPYKRLEELAQHASFEAYAINYPETFADTRVHTNKAHAFTPEQLASPRIDAFLELLNQQNR